MSAERDRLFEMLNANLRPIDPSAEDLNIRPDAYAESLAAVSLDELASWGVEHILIDYDGVFVNGDVRAPVDEPALDWAKQAVTDGRFKTVDIATDSGTSGPHKLVELLDPGIRVFSAFDRQESHGRIDYKAGEGGSSIFFRRVLFELGDAIDNPQTVVMIGDSPFNDINPAHLAGLRTVLVKSLIER